MINKYFGKLTLTDNMNEITYVILNEKYNSSFNLTQYIKEHQGKEIGLVIEINSVDVFCEVGKVEVISEVLMVNGRDISNVLWNETGKKINIIIDDMEEES